MIRTLLTCSLSLALAPIAAAQQDVTAFTNARVVAGGKPAMAAATRGQGARRRAQSRPAPRAQGGGGTARSLQVAGTPVVWRAARLRQARGAGARRRRRRRAHVHTLVPFVDESSTRGHALGTRAGHTDSNRKNK